MTKLFLITIILCLCASAFAQEPTWGCKIRQSTDVVTDVVTLDCRDKGSKETFVLDIPRSKWFPEWTLPGEQEFYYGIVENGIRYAVKTKLTACDTQFRSQFGGGGNRISDQLCGKMFKDDK
jgi:hypothetical protein